MTTVGPITQVTTSSIPAQSNGVASQNPGNSSAVLSESSTDPGQWDAATEARIQAGFALGEYVISHYYEQPRQDASAAMTSFNAAWQKQEKSIATQRPDLANANYDFVLKNGAFQVVSTTVSAKDQLWLDTQLNSNTQMLSAATQFNQAVDTYYDTSADPGIHGWVTNNVSGDQRQFANVQQQTENGAIQFRQLIAVTDQIASTGGLDPSVVDPSKASTASQIGPSTYSGNKFDFSIDAAEKFLTASAIQTAA